MKIPSDEDKTEKFIDAQALQLIMDSGPTSRSSQSANQISGSRPRGKMLTHKALV